MTSEIIILDKNIVPAILFGGKAEDGKEPLKELIAGFEKHARSLLLDVTTPKGRKEIASLAHQIARTKTTLDKMGKDLNEEKRKSIEVVNADRNFAKDRMQALQDEIRKPLTDWEDKEKDRVSAHEKALSDLILLFDLSDQPSIEQIEARIQDADEMQKRDWEEFGQKATREYEQGKEKLKAALDELIKRAKEMAELETLRKEKEAQEKKEREDRIAHEAAEKARLEAEAKAKAEREEAERKAKKEREAAEKAQKAAEDRAKEAEQAKKAAEKKAAQDAEDAATRERERIENEKKAETEAAAKREADKTHRAKINNAALKAFVKIGLSEGDGKKVVEAIAKQEVPNVRISY